MKGHFTGFIEEKEKFILFGFGFWVLLLLFKLISCNISFYSHFLHELFSIQSKIIVLIIAGKVGQFISCEMENLAKCVMKSHL